jgi:hypothetical protein
MLVKVLLVIGVLFALGSILWVVLLPGLVVSSIRSRTGFAARVEKLSVNPFTGSVTIKGLVLKNPEGWPADEFVELREFRAEAHLASLFSDRFVADEVVVDLKQVKVVRNQQGTLNATAFQNGFKGNSPDAAAQTKSSAGKQGFLIKHLVLKFDKLALADYSGRKPVIKEYSLAINQEMRDVDSVAKLMSPLTGSALGLVNEAAGGLLKVDPGLLRDATDLIQQAGKKTGEKLKGLLDSLDKKKP